jgi:DNA-binding transcriptional LysR family regulator
MLSLASAGSFVAAARATSLSQPSLHRAVRDVERLSGILLVERKGRGVALTTAGLRLVRAFRLAVGELENGLDEIEGLAGRDSGTIRIGAMPLARARLLPVATAHFLARYPAIRVEIVEGSHVELIEPLRDGRVDFLIGALRFPDPGPDVQQRTLFEDRLMVVAGRNHPLAGNIEPSLERLASFPWVMAGEGTPLRREWEAMFAEAGLAPPPAPITCGSVMAIRTLLSEGDFLTLLSPEQVRLEIAWGVLAAIGRPIEASRRPIGLTMRRDWHPTLTQTAFLKELESCATQATLPKIE